jgi:hypothetical protein
MKSLHTYMLLFVILLALCILQGSVSNAMEREQKSTNIMALSEIVNALKEDPLNRGNLDLLKNYLSGTSSWQTNPLPLNHPLFIKNNLSLLPSILVKTSETIEIIILFQDYDQELQDWVNEGRMIRVLDNLGRIIQIVSEDYVDGEWKGYFRTHFEYQGNSQDVYISMTEIWDEDLETWDNGGRRTRYVAYQNGSPVEAIDEVWENGEWQPFIKSVMSWTADRMPLETLDYFWTGVGWELSGRERWIWENGLLTELVNEWWDGEAWIVDMRWQYTYDNNGNEIEYIFQMSDWLTGELKNFFRELTSYDAQGNATETIDQMWDDENEEWSDISKTIYEEYDNRGNLIRSVDYTLIGDTWVPSSRDHYHYDGNGDLQMQVIEEWAGEDTWIPAYRVLYSGFDPTNVVSGEGLPDGITLLQNYPNPFNPSTTIRYSIPERIHVVLSIFNTLGQEIAKLVDEEVSAGNHAIKFDAAHLPSGVYIYRLQAGESVQSKKLMLLK